MSRLLTVLILSAFSLQANPRKYVPMGWLDLADCDTIEGWAWRSNGSREIVTIKDGKRTLITVVADHFRPDLLRAGVDDGAHGFFVYTPARLKDGKRHKVSAWVGKEWVGQTQEWKVICPPAVSIKKWIK